jgi:hemerythrin-like domain-containing protein
MESIRDRLTADHLRLDALFDDVLRRLALDDRDETRAAWNDFEKGLLAHLEVEEKFILPVFSVDHDVEARGIRAEHEAFRATLAKLGVMVDLHAIRMDVATGFVRALRDHARREDALMYRWAEENLAGETRAAVATMLRPPI